MEISSLIFNRPILKPIKPKIELLFDVQGVCLSSSSSQEGLSEGQVP